MADVPMVLAIDEVVTQALKDDNYVISSLLKHMGNGNCDAWPSVFCHPDHKLTLMVYVDDFVMAGTPEKLKVGLDLITTRAKLDLEAAHPVDKCLGCNHHIWTMSLMVIHVETVVHVLGRFASGFHYSIVSVCPFCGIPFPCIGQYPLLCAFSG